MKGKSRLMRYKKVGIIIFLFGAVYAARAFLLIKAPGELPVTNSYPFVIGVLLCISALGVFVCDVFPYPGSHIKEETSKTPLYSLLKDLFRNMRGRQIAAPTIDCATLPCIEGNRFSGFVSPTCITILCFIVYTILFERVGTIKASFIFSLILGTIWNRNTKAGETHQNFFTSYFAANKLNIAENILASCACVAGIWLVFERVFSLSLP
jgi:hypothetical protein